MVDNTKKIDLTGVVTKMEWTNPHARFFIDVKGPDGKVVNWSLELASPSILVRNGWKRYSIKEGDNVSLCSSDTFPQGCGLPIMAFQIQDPKEIILISHASSYRQRAISAPVVHDNYLGVVSCASHRLRQFIYASRDILLFVQSWNNDRY